MHPSARHARSEAPREDRREDRLEKWREHIAVVLLSVTAVLTAWTGFQSSKWGGAMSISFAEASTSRIVASRHDDVANRKLTVQVALFTQWLQAFQAHDRRLQRFLEQRFPEPLATAFPAWVATRPLTNPNAPATPFDMAQYAIPDSAQAHVADQQADAKFQQALQDDHRSETYTALTIGFASVLFFTALSARMPRPAGQWALLGLACAGFAVLVVVLALLPKMV